MKKLRCITITTDASFCPKTKSAGWAFRIKWNGGSVARSGGFRNDVPSNIEAERMAICNALHVLIKLKLRSRLLVVNCDCMPVINDKNQKGSTGSSIRIRYNLQKKARRWVDKISYRHVKAHSNVNDKRSWANEWCDTQAKKAMRKVRDSKKIK